MSKTHILIYSHKGKENTALLAKETNQKEQETNKERKGVMWAG